LLEGAVNELWSIQKDISETKPSPIDENSLTSLSVSVAKVQFVQAFLEDISLPLPEDNEPHRTKETSAAEVRTEEDNHENGPSETAKVPIPPVNPNLVDEDMTAIRSRSESKATAASSRLASSSFSSPSPSKHTPRPRLTESSYSWMLGQDKKDGSSFSRASPFSPNEKRYHASLGGHEKGFLFGADGESQETKRKSKGSQKGQPSTGPGVPAREEIGLGNLNINENIEG
jgi:hypothetical protein